MTTVLRLKQAGQIAFQIFASKSNTELAGLTLWTVLGLIASVPLLAAISGDQTAGDPATIYEWFAG